MSEFSEKMNESFVFYASFFEAIEGLPAKDQLKMYQTIAKYALKGEENELKQSLKNLWVLIRPQIIASQKRRCNGKNGGLLSEMQTQKNNQWLILKTTKG